MPAPPGPMPGDIPAPGQVLPGSHQCSFVIGKKGEMAKTLDKDEQMDRQRVKTLDKDEKVITGKMERGRVNKFYKDEEIITVYQPYKKLAR